MKLWEELEDYLFDRDLLSEEFNHAALMEDLSISAYKATSMIQSYLKAQTRENSKTLFVLRRVAGTRTTNAMWHVGARSSDIRALGSQWTDDAKRRIRRVIEPSIVRISEKNPRALPAAQAVAKGIEASLELMAALLGDDFDT